MYAYYGTYVVAGMRMCLFNDTILRCSQNLLIADQLIVSTELYSNNFGAC